MADTYPSADLIPATETASAVTDYVLRVDPSQVIDDQYPTSIKVTNFFPNFFP